MEENMNLLREKLLLLWKRIIQAYADYRVTVSAVALLTIYMAVEDFLYIFDYETRGKLLIAKCFVYSRGIIVGLLLFICGAMFAESCFSYEQKEKKVRAVRFFCFLSAGVLAAFLGVGLSVEKSTQIFQVSGSQIRGWAEQFALGCALLLLLGTVYFCHRKSGVDFTEYMLHVLANLCVTTAVYIVLYIGVSLALTVVDTLFVDSVLGSFATSGAILVTGFYYVPCCITALRNMDSDIDRSPGKYLLRDVVTSLTIFAMMIVYAYLFKILLRWEMPSNEIFGIVTGLFCFGMPIWIMDCYYWDDTRYMRILQKLPYGLLPMIPLQIYAMGVRIYEHGMTPDRYLGMVMVVVEIAVLVIWHFWKEKMERVLPVLGVCVIVAFLVPGINANSLSDRWQRAFLETYYQKLLTQGSLTQTECGRLKGAYHYLEGKPEMASVVERCNIYEESFAEKLAETGMDMETYTRLESHEIHCCQMVGSLDVTGYESFDMLNQNLRYSGAKENRIPVDFSAFRFYKRETGTAVTVDISDFANRCMAYEKEHPDAGEEEFTAAMKPYQRIDLGDGRVLYLNHFKVRYQDGIKDGKAYFEIESVDISGMLLEKIKNSFGLPMKEDTALLVTVKKHFSNSFSKNAEKISEEYEYDSQGRMLRYMEDGAGNLTDREYEYDGEGNLLKKTCYKVQMKDGEPLRWQDGIVRKIEYLVKYSYGTDESGRRIRTEREYDGNGILQDEWVYDREETLLKRMTYSSGKAGQLLWEYEYNPEEGWMQSIDYDDEGNVERRYLTEYDDHGSVIFYGVYDGEGNDTDDGDCDCGPDVFVLFGQRYEYEYDEAGNLILQTGFDENEKQTGHMENSYDEKGNLIKEALYDAENTLREYKEYSYDEKGNLEWEYSYYDYEEQGVKRGYEYDGAGHCIRVWTAYCDYEGKEEKTPTEDSAYTRWEREYDAQGRMVKYTYVPNKEWYRYIYTPVGDLDEDYPYDRIKVR